MRHRVFIAINLSGAAKAAVKNLADKIRPSIAAFSRFAPPENWHITLSFLGYQDNGELVKICWATGRAAKKLKADAVTFARMAYGPPGRMPRMVWLLADKKSTSYLAFAKNILEEELDAAGVRFKKENRPFAGHLTLARFKNNAPLRAELPDIEEKIGVYFEAASLDVMESELKRSGAEYAILQKSDFSAS